MLLEVPSGDVVKYHFDLVAHIGWRICSKGKQHRHDMLAITRTVVGACTPRVDIVPAKSHRTE